MNIHRVGMSRDRRYRYWLETTLSDEGNHACLFLMLNPSAADEVNSDPTVSACKRFAKNWGYGKLRVCNLFALRSPYPKVMKDSHEPVGTGNDEWILKNARDSDVIVCAWGNDGKYLNRNADVLRMLHHARLSGKMRHLGLTKLGEPRHPLRLRANTTPVRFIEN